jgi:hypothetical protein
MTGAGMTASRISEGAPRMVALCDDDPKGSDEG